MEYTTIEVPACLTLESIRAFAQLHNLDVRHRNFRSIVLTPKPKSQYATNPALTALRTLARAQIWLLKNQMGCDITKHIKKAEIDGALQVLRSAS